MADSTGSLYLRTGPRSGSRSQVIWRVRGICRAPCSNCRRSLNRVQRMSSEINGSKTQIIVAVITLIGVLGGALFANWDKLFPQNQGATPKPPPGIEEKSPDPAPSRARPSPLPKAEVNISGVWRDVWGNTSQVTQQGDRFTYTARGTACNGVIFESSGTGTVRGNSVESDYRSNLSQGHCSGTVSSDERQMTSICKDTACGQFQSIAERQ